MIERAMGDDKGDIYILTRSGFYHYDKNYKLLSRFDFYSEEKVAVTHFYFGRGLFELDSKRLLITSIGGLYIYDKESRQFKKMTAADCPLMAEFLNYPDPDSNFININPESSLLKLLVFIILSVLLE
jgi:hypothetical protein